MTGPPPLQRPRISPPQIPSTGGTVTNLGSFNVENTHISDAFNNNSQNYCKYEVSMQHPNPFLKFVKIKAVHLPRIESNTMGLIGCQDPIKVKFHLPVGHSEVANSKRQFNFPSKPHFHNRWGLAVLLVHTCQ